MRNFSLCNEKLNTFYLKGSRRLNQTTVKHFELHERVKGAIQIVDIQKIFIKNMDIFLKFHSSVLLISMLHEKHTLYTRR